VGVEVSPIRLIRRIKNGLEIPGLQEALIKILQDFHLQISLLEGCQTILNGDISDFSRMLQKNQTSGFFLTCEYFFFFSLSRRLTSFCEQAKSVCSLCSRLLHTMPQELIFLFLCRHVVHASCVSGGDNLPLPPDPILRHLEPGNSAARGLSGSIALYVPFSPVDVV
jgi:vacuolar protein sorting-associated protein 41